ncbi:MAG: flavodoxin family protein [Methanolinea sp.]|nr:flavodoxin family protein [Methanolinea sp.]
MKTLVVYVSVHHGNTEKVARAIAGELGADLVTIDGARQADLKAYDLICFGSGIFFGKHHKSLLEFVENLPHGEGKKAFVFSTSGKGDPAQNAFLKDLLKKKGYAVIGEFACKGWDSWGPFRIIGGINKGRPNESDLEEAKEFARGLKERFRTTSSS